MNCPGSEGDYGSSYNRKGERVDNGGYISTTISKNITDAFTSATKESDYATIASIFDIQYRSFYNFGNATAPSSGPWFDKGEPRTQGATSFFESMILNDDIKAVEGLLVDTVKGGIGFRNHTLPPENHFGTEWFEDILWLEPDTVCVDFNVSLDYTLDSSAIGSLNARLSDRGGFTGLIDEYPEFDLSKSQTDPLLWQRAWKGAELTIFNMLVQLNVTEVPKTIGTTYPVDTFGGYKPAQVSTVAYGESSTGAILPYPLTLQDPLSVNYSSLSNSSSKYLGVGIVTQGYGGLDFIDINTPIVSTGIILGAGLQVDDNDNLLPANDGAPKIAPLTHWRQNLYSCAATLKASVKTVHFRMEGVPSIPHLQILEVKPKAYKSKSAQPIWAIENTKLTINDVDPFWGIISPSYETSPYLQTVRAEHLYLPAGQSAILGGLSWGYSSVDANAGGNVPASNLDSIFSSGVGDDTTGIPNYSGANSFPLFQKWQAASRSADTVGSIVDLIWTDLMANTVVGANSLLSQPGGTNTAATTAPYLATVYTNGVQYNWLYGIPALLLLAIYVLLLAICIFLLVSRQFTIGLLRHMLNQTAAGRAVTAERYGHSDENHAPTRYWADTVGSEQIKITKDVPKTGFGQAAASNISSPLNHNPGGFYGHPGAPTSPFGQPGMLPGGGPGSPYGQPGSPYGMPGYGIEMVRQVPKHS